MPMVGEIWLSQTREQRLQSREDIDCAGAKDGIAVLRDWGTSGTFSKSNRKDIWTKVLDKGENGEGLNFFGR